jgi:hypothetical protein
VQVFIVCTCIYSGTPQNRPSLKPEHLVVCLFMWFVCHCDIYSLFSSIILLGTIFAHSQTTMMSYQMQTSTLLSLTSIILTVILDIYLILYFKLNKSLELVKYPLNKRWRKPKGQSRIDNSETLTILGTQYTRRRQANTKTQHNTEN